MMIDPPIDKLIEKTGCKYALACLVAKRAKQVVEKRAGYLEETGERPVSVASQEIYGGKVEIGYEE